MNGVLLALALAATAVLAAVCVLLVRRSRRADRRIARLEDEVRALSGRLDGVGSDARAAAVTARRAAAAAGVDDPPRVPLEPVTGRVVKAVAFSAGARRALARLADPRVRRRSRAA